MNAIATTAQPAPFLQPLCLRTHRVMNALILLLLLGVLALILAQPLLIHLPRYTLPELSALHPVNGLAIGVLAFVIHQRLRTAPR